MDFCVSCGAYFGPRFTAPDDPVVDGRRLLVAGNLAEGMDLWVRAVLERFTPDDSQYRSMVDSVADCMISVKLTDYVYESARVPDLALLLHDREVIPDIMESIAGKLGGCRDQNSVLALANACMFLYMDCFSVYTDLRELAGHSGTALGHMDAMLDRASGLEDKIKMGPEPVVWLRSYRDFIMRIREALMEAIGSCGRVDELADYWANRDGADYATHIGVAFMLSNRSVTAGRSVSKSLLKSCDAQIGIFLTKYLDGGKRFTGMP